jgi:hypothetical protein
MNYKQIFFTALIFFTSILACVVPGLQTASAPAPTVDTDILSTVVAATVSESIAQTAQATTPTPALMPTDTVTATPKVSLSGTSLLLRDDQTTVFTDREAGIEFVIPAGFMPVRVNEQEYYEAFSSNAATDPLIYDRLVQIQNADTTQFRLDAIDIRPGHVFNGIITDFHYVFKANDPRGLEEISENLRSADSIWVNYEFTSSRYEQAANGIKILVVERKYGPPTEAIFHRSIVFKIPSGMIVLDFYSPLDFKDTVLPDFEKVVNSLILLNP